MNYKLLVQSGRRMWRAGWIVCRGRVRALRARLAADIPAFMEFARILSLGMLWAWFEVHRHVWDWLKPRLLRLGIAAYEPHRLVFCIVTTVPTGTFALVAAHIAVSLWTLGACVVVGIVTHVCWRNGWLWCRQQLGFRPSRLVDLRDPFGNLVFDQ